jgi:hypothetical protein
VSIDLRDEAYLAWLCAEHESGRALQAWLNGGPRRRDDAYLEYRAALEREDAAARDLARLTGRPAAAR